MAETRTYVATPEAVERIATKLRSHGIEMDAANPTGSGKAMGFHVQWKIEPNRLAVTMLEHPIIGKGLFWSAVEDELGKPIA